MVVVTGTPRSGTSFVMNTLQTNGYPVVGDKFSPEFGPEEFNPNGFWELPIEQVCNGISHNKFKGKAVKLFGLYANLSDIRNFEGLIYCARNKKDSVRSLFSLINSVGQFRGTVAWMIAENSYEINLRHAREVYARYHGPKTVLSIDEGSMTEKFIKEFVSWPTQQQL